MRGRWRRRSPPSIAPSTSRQQMLLRYASISWKSGRRSRFLGTSSGQGSRRLDTTARAPQFRRNPGAGGAGPGARSRAGGPAPGGPCPARAALGPCEILGSAALGPVLVLRQHAGLDDIISLVRRLRSIPSNDELTSLTAHGRARPGTAPRLGGSSRSVSAARRMARGILFQQQGHTTLRTGAPLEQVRFSATPHMPPISLPKSFVKDPKAGFRTPPLVRRTFSRHVREPPPCVRGRDGRPCLGGASLLPATAREPAVSPAKRPGGAGRPAGPAEPGRHQSACRRLTGLPVLVSVSGRPRSRYGLGASPLKQNICLARSQCTCGLSKYFPKATFRQDDDYALERLFDAESGLPKQSTEWY